MNISIANALNQLVSAYPEPRIITIYTDASVLPFYKNNYRSGVGLLFEIESDWGFHTVEASIKINTDTSSLAELWAVEMALDCCPTNPTILIINDCLSTINLLNEASIPSKHIDVVKRILLKKRKGIGILYSPREIKGMTIADALAREASISRKDRITFKGI